MGIVLRSSLLLVVLITSLPFGVVFPGSEPETDDLELTEMGTMLEAIQNLTQAQKDVLLQQELQEKATKERLKLDVEREEARTEVLQDEQGLLKQIRGKISRQLKVLKKNSPNSVNNNNQYPLNGKRGPKDCADIYLDGEEDSGVYRVWSSWNFNRSFFVYCDMDTDGGGWTVIHRQGSPGFPKSYFQRTWNDYKYGFGDLTSDFWIGNDNIQSLTTQGAYSIRIDFGKKKNNEYALYNTFWIEDESRKYRLHVQGFDSSSSAGDILSDHHDGAEFTTLDKGILREPNCYSNCRTSITNHYNSDISWRISQCESNCEFEDCTGLMNNRGWWYKSECSLDSKLQLNPLIVEDHKVRITEIKLRPVNFLKTKEIL